MIHQSITGRPIGLNELVDWFNQKNIILIQIRIVESLRYLTCTRPDILFEVGLVNRFMKTPTMIHFKALKRILWYVKDIVDFDLFYGYSNSFDLVGYSDSDWAKNINGRKCTTGFVFYLGDTTFTRGSKKQSIVILSTRDGEYIAITSCVYHSIWLKRLLRQLRMSQKKPTKIYVDNSSVIVLDKNSFSRDKNN